MRAHVKKCWKGWIGNPLLVAGLITAARLSDDWLPLAGAFIIVGLELSVWQIIQDARRTLNVDLQIEIVDG